MQNNIIVVNINKLKELITMALDLWLDNTYEGLRAEILKLIGGGKIFC
ncbi:hypothetical protein [Tissierella carlieri]|uniref:Uncharacterized protein n=1 Tax=Tissierella carlieri TaxID=689904 RepID=A0ABT1S8I5_9FIRM|nr:hypothetical protein [Tissierella carlieri]MCQ4922778.1 hypothetical protein [Tissierella carlieri]MDU5082939.1 hypothetical protein [Bacillota bacterium]